VERSYVDAGADIILTNTFGGNRFALSKYDIADRLEEINPRGAGISKEAAGGRALECPRATQLSLAQHLVPRLDAREQAGPGPAAEMARPQHKRAPFITGAPCSNLWGPRRCRRREIGGDAAGLQSGRIRYP
jgi:hypothetical protein